MKKIISSFLASTIAATSLIGAPQAVVFDFGGVLTGEPNREIIISFLRESFDLSRADFERVNEEKRLAIKQGKTDEEFWISYAQEKGIKLPSNWGESFKAVMKDGIGINQEMFALVQQLKERHIPVALLSNIDERLARIIREIGFYEPFDPCILSFEIGVEKPDLKAYEFLLTKLALPAKEIVFIDDLPENIESAQKLGIDAILFESPEQIRSALRQRGAL